MSETTGKILLCYDVSGKHTEVMKALLDLNYFNTTTDGPTNHIYKLPDTTVWHNIKQVSQAVKDLEKICSNLNIKLEKALAILVKNEIKLYN